MKRKFKVYDGNYGQHILELKEDGTCWADDHDDYIAVSEAFENDVVMLPEEKTTYLRIDMLINEKEKARAEWLAVAAHFDDKIAKLRALPHLPLE